MIDYGFGCTLGPVYSEDLDTLMGWRNDTRVRKWCRQYDLINEIQQATWYETQAIDNTISMYGISVSNKLVGVCGFTDIDKHNRRAEFSLYTAPEYQGQGIAKAALKTLIAHGFLSMGFNSIWGETYEGNVAGKLFKELGMVLEGTRREFYFRGGKFIDAYLYSVLRSDWDNLFPYWAAGAKTGSASRTKTKGIKFASNNVRGSKKSSKRAQTLCKRRVKKTKSK